MTSYNEDFTFPVAFPKEHMVNILGDVLEANGVKQFRTAETEKVKIDPLCQSLWALTERGFLYKAPHSGAS